MPRAAVALVVALMIAIGGCGDEFDGRERPAPITLQASVTPRAVTVAPASIGAGPIELVVRNLTPASLQVTLRSEALSAGTAPLQQSTGPINPGDTGALSAELVQGTYRITTSPATTTPARIRVGPQRSSAPDQLLQP
ncbi:MAG: hypothetical protein Q8O56_14130 [Solirubrobacteraceae bacterium]|nr:hypothetical protein [Solirubrobacteraceae bacterium]